MPSAQEFNCLAVLQAASTSALGIVVRTNNPASARQKLYNFRKDLGDPTFADIHIRVSPDDSEHELWLLRHSPAAAPTVFFALTELF
jgi:hypothetical protein